MDAAQGGNISPASIGTSLAINAITEGVSSKTVKGQKGEVSTESNSIMVDSYKNLRKNREISGQAHHLNQDAAFRDIIPKNNSMAIKLEGNIRKDIGSPHYNAHASLEKFWDQYRKGGEYYGEKPTMYEYNQAVINSLHDAGLTVDQANEAVKRAIQQQIEYGLIKDSLIPRIPGKIYLPK